MSDVKVATALGSTAETLFALAGNDGAEIDLTALGATKVTVSVCCNGVNISIDSDGDAVSFSGSIVRVQFGQLPLAADRFPYYPKISYTTPDSRDNVIAGREFLTPIQLFVNC